MNLKNSPETQCKDYPGFVDNTKVYNDHLYSSIKYIGLFLFISVRRKSVFVWLLKQVSLSGRA